MHSRQRWCDGGAVEPCSNLSLLQTTMMWWYDVTVIWRYEDMRSWRCRDRDTGGWGPRSGRPSATPPCCSSSWVGTWSTVILETYCEILLSPLMAAEYCYWLNIKLSLAGIYIMESVGLWWIHDSFAAVINIKYHANNKQCEGRACTCFNNWMF